MIIREEKQIKHILFETNKNVFITGPGGTGKTTLIKEYIDKNKNVIVCSPTGVAAINAGGETMHKIFNIPVPAFGANTNKITPSKIKELIIADTIIIDEISMCRVDVFVFAMKVLKKAEKQKGKKIRLIVVGDFFQLPPVVTKEDEKLLKKFKFDKSGYPFTCKEWEQCNFTIIELLEVKRQDNLEFIENLHKARIADKKCIPYFNRFIENKEYPEDAIRICGTNAEAERINNEYLDNLEGMPYAYKSKREGTIVKSIVEDIILLKPGAKVYFNVNDNINNDYANGTFGEIISCNKDNVDVLVDGKLINVKYHKYPIYTYKVTNNILTKKEIGSISQIPLKIAKAITIHKSQGKTFDKEVFSPQIFASGQLYVALSRVRTPEGLFITEPIIEDYLIVDPIIKKFYKNDYKWEVKTTTSNKAKTCNKNNKVIEKKTTTKKSSNKKKENQTGKVKSKSTKSNKNTKSTTTKKRVVKKTTSKKKTTKK